MLVYQWSRNGQVGNNGAVSVEVVALVARQFDRQMGQKRMVVPNDKIIVELQDHHWSAWFEARTEALFGADSDALAPSPSLKAYGIDPALAQPIGEGRTVTIGTREIAGCDTVLRYVHNSD